MKTTAITADDIRQHPSWYPGATVPGEYAYSENDNVYRLLPEQTGMDFDGGFGIGGLGRYEEKPVVPSAAAIDRYQKAVKAATVCRLCGASSLDGAMFTTLAGKGICDDCV